MKETLVISHGTEVIALPIVLREYVTPMVVGVDHHLPVQL